MRVEYECPSADYGELTFDLDSFKLSVVGENRLDGRPRFRHFPLVTSKLADRNTLCSVPRKPKQAVKRAVRGLYLQSVIQNNQGITYGIEDRLSVFPFVNGLVYACTKRGDIRECQGCAQNLAIASAVGRYSKKKAFIAIAGFGPVWCSVSDHPCADPIEIFHTSEDIAKRATDFRRRHAKDSCRGAIHEDNAAFAADYNYRKINSVKQANIIADYPVKNSIT
jgi:hypothetical protein